MAFARFFGSWRPAKRRSSVARLHRTDTHSPIEVAVCHRGIMRYDAIGNDIAGMCRVLAPHYRCVVYGEQVTVPGLRAIDRDKLHALLRDDHNLVIYHHSINWPEGEDLLAGARARIIIRYHNITEPDLFLPYHPNFYRACLAGRQQTARLKRDLPHALWMADSRFNLNDAGLDGQRATAVIPPFHSIEHWSATRPDARLLRALIEGRMLNLLFVGRVSPNKGHRLLLEAVADHIAHYGRPVRLHVVGAPLGPDDRYYRELESLVRQLGLESSVRFTGPVDDPTLLAYYLGSDYFVCASEHEGFCVPLVEAQSLCLPVLAKNTPALRETLGPDQLTLGGTPEEFSAALDVLVCRPEYRDWLVQRGRANFEQRFTRSRIAAQFLSCIDGFLAASP